MGPAARDDAVRERERVGAISAGPRLDHLEFGPGTGRAASLAHRVEAASDSRIVVTYTNNAGYTTAVSSLLKNSRRSREGGSPENPLLRESMTYWIPAAAGMTICLCKSPFSTNC